MKFKVMALAAMIGLGAGGVQANELPNGPHIVTSGTASVDAVPDIATLAIEVNVSAKDAAAAKKQADDRVAQYLTFLQENGVEKKISIRRTCALSRITTTRTAKAFLKAIARSAPLK